MFCEFENSSRAGLPPGEEIGERQSQVKETCADGIAVICLAKDNIEVSYLECIIKSATERCVYEYLARSLFFVCSSRRPSCAVSRWMEIASVVLVPPMYLKVQKGNSQPKK